jgi:hypothetical protein
MRRPQSRQLSTVHMSLVWVGLLIAVHLTPVSADTVDFEGFPDSTVFTTQYPGLTFSNTIILTSGISLNEFEFPPHSGENVASDNGGPIMIDFSTPIISFSGYFTYLEPLTLDGFDASDVQVASAISMFSNNLACLAGPPCSGDPGSSPNEFIQVMSAAGISSVMITGDPLGGSFTMDDMTYSSSNSQVPEPDCLSLLLIGTVGLFAACLRRKQG